MYSTKLRIRVEAVVERIQAEELFSQTFPRLKEEIIWLTIGSDWMVEDE